MPDLYRKLDVTRWCELDGVAHQVVDHLGQAHGIAEQSNGKLRVNGGVELNPLLRSLGPEDIHYVADQLFHGERNAFEDQLSSLDLRKIQDIVKNGKQ